MLRKIGYFFMSFLHIGNTPISYAMTDFIRGSRDTTPRWAN